MPSDSMPQPAEQKCPNCGTMAPLDMVLCPRCGMQLSAPSKAFYRGATWVFQLFLSLLALGFGASGACFALFGLSNNLDNWVLGAIGVALLGLAAGCIWAIFRIAKSCK